MIKILNAESTDYSAVAQNILNNVGAVKNEDLYRNELINLISDYDILIVRLRNNINRDILKHAKNLKVIVTATTGLDHIDIAAAAEQGITILSLKGEVEFLRSIPATAEHTWGLLLSLIRKIPWAHQSVLMGQWDRNHFRGLDLANRNLGIVGLGRIGEKIARYGAAFGMNVFAFDPYRNDWLDDVKRAHSLESLCTQCDVISLHIPHNADTIHLFGKKQLSCLSSNALLINTARGSVLDELALLDSLESGNLAGAALDVISDEINPSRKITDLLINYSLKHSNLLLTPHIGGATTDSMHATEVFMAHKLNDFVHKNFSLFSN